MIGFVGSSGSGKTTLLEKVVPLLTDRGMHVGVLKQAHSKFDIDHPGKDSYRLRRAGAEQMLVVSDRRWALMVETAEGVEPTLEQIVGRFEQKSLDVVLVEGARYMSVPKIEVGRIDLGGPPLYLKDTSIIAVANDFTTDLPDGIYSLDINNPVQVANFILNRICDVGQDPAV